jgi:hypothetical protein
MLPLINFAKKQAAPSAASVVADPKAKSRQKKIAKDSIAKAVEIENDLA